jgi:hypothetical protein
MLALKTKLEVFNLPIVKTQTHSAIKKQARVLKWRKDTQKQANEAGNLS